MKKEIITLLLAALAFIANAQNSDPVKDLQMKQSSRHFAPGRIGPSVSLGIIGYRGNFYWMDSTANQRMRIYWMDSTQVVTADRLPVKLKTLHQNVRVYYLSETKYPKAFDSLKRNLRKIAVARQ